MGRCRCCCGRCRGARASRRTSARRAREGSGREGTRATGGSRVGRVSFDARDSTRFSHDALSASILLSARASRPPSAARDLSVQAALGTGSSQDGRCTVARQVRRTPTRCFADSQTPLTGVRCRRADLRLDSTRVDLPQRRGTVSSSLRPLVSAKPCSTDRGQPHPPRLSGLSSSTRPSRISLTSAPAFGAFRALSPLCRCPRHLPGQVRVRSPRAQRPPLATSTTSTTARGLPQQPAKQVYPSLATPAPRVFKGRTPSRMRAGRGVLVD